MDDSLLVAMALVAQADPLLLAFAVIVFEIPRYTFSLIALAIHRGLRKPRLDEPDSHHTVSVVIAAFNAGSGLLRTVRSLRHQTLPPMEIIVVNDGSTDDTRVIAEKAREDGLIDTVIHHGTRCGKSAGVNSGVRFARGSLVMTADADTIFERDALARLAAAFNDPRVAAASGNLAVANTGASITTALQELEYMISISAGRSFLNLIDAMACCSGACAMYRRDVYLRHGGLNVGPGEDLEYTLRLRRLGHKVRFVPEAWAATDVPDRFLALVRQRMRWDRDALRIRLIEYREAWPFRRERLADTLQRLDFMVFEFIPTILFPFYIAFCFALMGSAALVFLLAIYIFVLMIALLNIAVANLLFGQTASYFSLLVAPIFALYAIVMKFVRFAAFSSEILFMASRRDDYVPPRVRKALFSPPTR